MLRERDRRELAGIEHHLATGDPGLARRLRRRPRRLRVPGGRAGGLAVIGAVLAVMLMVLGLVGQALLVLIVLCLPLMVRMGVRRLRRGESRTDPSD